MSVHVRGKISFMDEERTIEVIRSVTEKYEGNSEYPSLLENMPEDYVRRNVKAIVGFEILAEEIKNIFKLSQNHDSATRQSIIEKLKARGDHHSVAIADEMEKRF
jgi:transcriptional regulator